MTWDFLKRLRDTTKMKIVLKGILAHEDAVLAAERGMDGIIVSNHGARSEDSGRSTIDALPEIVEAVRGRIPILVDSGFPPRHRHRQGARAGRAGRVRRASLHLGTRRVRTAGRGARDGAASRRAGRDHAAGRRALDQGPQAGDGAQGVAATPRRDASHAAALTLT
jgi:hypothetical protein